MTIDEAIKIIGTLNPKVETPADKDIIDAIRLGREALNLVQALILLGKGKFKVILPGETEE